jgi:hypothetical protein
MDNGIYSGIVGGIVGAVLTGIFSIILVYRSERFEKKELSRKRIAEALPLTIRLFDSFTGYKPNRLFQIEIGMKLSEQSTARLISAIELYDECKSMQYLLPPVIRRRWDSMLILISEYSNNENMDEITRNRAHCDVQNYIFYIRKSLMDLLDEKELRPELERPFLQREDVRNWEES